jgi:hypothetical protein
VRLDVLMCEYGGLTAINVKATELPNGNEWSFHLRIYSLRWRWGSTITGINHVLMMSETEGS